MELAKRCSRCGWEVFGTVCVDLEYCPKCAGKLVKLKIEEKYRK